MKSDCQQVLGQLDDWIDGALDAVELAELQDHLALCDSCGTTFDAHSALIGDLRALGGLADRAVANPSVAKRRSVWPRVLRMAAMIAVVIGVVTVIWKQMGQVPLKDAPKNPIAMRQDDATNRPSGTAAPDIRLAASDSRILVNDKTRNPRIHILWLYQPVQKVGDQLNNANEMENPTNG